MSSRLVPSLRRAARLGDHVRGDPELVVPCARVTQEGLARVGVPECGLTLSNPNQEGLARVGVLECGLTLTLIRKACRVPNSSLWVVTR